MQRREQHPRHRRDPAIQPQFADNDKPLQRIRWQHAQRRQQAERDRQVVMAAFLGQIGRRQVDDDAARRQRQPDGVQRRLHPFAAFLHRLVGQADGQEAGGARRHLHLHIDAARLEPEERHRSDMRDHP